MVAHFTPSRRDAGSQADLDTQDLDPDSAGAPVEPVRPSEAPRLQALALVPSPATLAIFGGGIASACVGGAIGYWLGKRRARRPARPIHNLAQTVDSVVELAPVAMHLLANPLVRALALRMVLRQISRRIDH